ncbi:hypothetical protein ACTWPT_38855 [Nonomuraea sp. 3N208]
MPAFTDTSTTLTDAAPWPAEQMSGIFGAPGGPTPRASSAMLTATAEIPA